MLLVRVLRTGSKKTPRLIFVGRSACCEVGKSTATPSVCPLLPGRTGFPGSIAATANIISIIIYYDFLSIFAV